MSKNPSIWRYYGLVLVAWALYIYFTLNAQPTAASERLGLSEGTITFIRITLLVPYMLTWLIAIKGWFHFKQFVRDLKRKKIANYTGFSYIGRGLGILIIDLMLIPLLGTVRNAYENNEGFAILIILLSNYLHVLIPLVAFIYMYLGSRKLILSSRYAAALRSRVLPSLFASGLFTALFTAAVFSNTSRQVAGTGQFASYYISDPLIFLTIIIPLFVTWFLGLETALNTERYVHSLLQPQWRKAIIHFFHGLLAVVSSLIILQAVTAFGNQQLLQVNLALLLSVLYLFIIVQAGGYLYIRKGAKLLRKLIRAGVPNETH